MVDAAERVLVHYPYTERLDLVEELHGHRVADPYRWLEDPGDPRTATWSAAQDELFEAHQSTWPARERFRDRLAELLSVGLVSAPIWRRGRGFFLRRAEGQEHALLLAARPDGTERVLVDPMRIDPTGTTTLDYWYPSPDGTRLAYAQSTGGTEDSELRVIDVESGALVEGPIDRVRFSTVAWLPDGDSFYYTRYLGPGSVDGDDPRLHRRVYLHRVGTDPERDVLVAGTGAPRGRYYFTDVSADGRWLVVIARQGTDPRNDVWIADLAASPLEAPDLRVLQEGVDAATTPLFRGGRLYLWTDRDAPRGRLCVASTDDLSYPAWRDLIAEDPEAVLADVAFLDGAELDRPALLVAHTRHAVSELAVHDLDSGERRGAVEISSGRASGARGSMGSVVALTDRRDGGHEAWFTHTDYTSPSTVYRYDAREGSVTPWARPPGAVRTPAMTTRQVEYASKDGTAVRMFLVARADLPAGPHPTVLYGYGGFNIAQTPGFSATATAWVEAGGVYAVANLRGGSEEGEQWHRAGMLASKQNVFDDFHAAADWLVHNGVTSPGQLGIMGGSNGGLLVGAAVTQRPEAYAAVVCSAPLLDMVRYEHFGLGATWAGEYGTAQDPEQLRWLLAYSPYHHVRETVHYPAVLFTVFDSDTRVDPLHARKLTAALQHATAGTQPILLRRERDVGHAARSVSRTVALGADQLAFLAVATDL